MTQQMKFTHWEGMSLLCVAFIFQAFNELITITVREVGNAAWIAQLLSGFLAVGVLYLYLALFRRFEGKSLLEIVDEVFGRFFSKVVHAALLVYILLLVSVTLHEIVMLLRSFAYAEVGPLFLCIVLMGISVVVCRHPVKGLAMTTSLFLPAFILLIALVMALTLPQANPHYLSPVFGYGAQPIAKHSFYLISNYENLLILSIFLPSYGSTKRFEKSALTAIAVAVSCFLGVTLCYCLMFPYNAIFQNSSAMLNMTQSVYINRFLQRFESAFVAGVTSSVILVLCVKLIALKKVYCHIFRIRSENANAVLYAMAAGVILVTESLAALNAHENSYRSVAHRYSAYFMVGFILLTLAVRAIRKKGTRQALRYASLLLAPILLLTLFAGCGGYHEPDEETYPIIMGYDKGEVERYKITFRYMLGKEAEGTPDVNNMLSIDENGDPPPEIFVVEAPSALLALDYISSLVPKRFSLMHINMIVISEELAREDLESIVSPIIRHKETKNTMAFLITRGAAQDTIMQPTGKMDSSLPMYIESILEGRNGISNYDTVTIKDVYNHFEEGYGDGIAMYAGYEGYDDNNNPQAFLIHGEDDGQESEVEMEADKEISNGGAEESPQGGAEESNDASTTGATPEGSIEEEEGTSESEAPPDSQKIENKDSTASEREDLGPAGLDETLPPRNRPAADQVKTELSEKLLHGYIPGQIPVKSSAKMEISGMAILKDKKMVGYIDSRENAIHMMLKGNFRNAYYHIQDPHQEDVTVVFRVHTRQPTKIKATIDEDGTPHISLDVYLKGRLAVAQNTSVRYTEPAHRRELEQYASQQIEAEAKALLDKLQHEFEADTLSLGKEIASKFLTIQKWEEYNWMERYPDTDVRVNVNFKL